MKCVIIALVRSTVAPDGGFPDWSVIQEMLESTVRTSYSHSVGILASQGGAAGDA